MQVVLIAFALLFCGVKAGNTQKQCSTDCEGNHWSYSGDSSPKCWSICNPKCQGTRQSPINLQIGKAKFMGIFQAPEVSGPLTVKMKASNNGHTVVLAKTSGQSIHISGVGLDGSFIFDQLHFHWGSEASTGSEHTLNGNHWPMEMHVVTHNDKYESIGEAKTAPDGLAVFAYFFQIVKQDNPGLSDLLAVVDSVPNKGDSSDEMSFQLVKFLPPFGGDFFRYKGSLTTPGCFESVTWTLFTGLTVPISENQLNKFRQLMTAGDGGKDAHPMFNNFRPTQALNAREILFGVIGA
ncbi:hypothetical protein CAPTEDRAFT_198261 [Capitella teleta]|uniref:carbonic anhydrase n=1 Tax=Capitella teleta TaxID=283909 RepID=R7U0D8_CAPTE|nr:hypothetical protein CAPTEDRAFT_198261 [Capitella teleta]|eukprot:ELT99673.1 hypothetical protein CAPTEDRAFT_198261 [Capitella teleta]